MERNQKEYNSVIYDLAFAQTNKCASSTYVHVILIILQYALFLLKFYDLISPIPSLAITIPYFTVFIVLAIFIVIFVIFTLVSYNFQWLTTLWIYSLLLLQSMQMLYVQLAVRCFTGANWSQSDSKTQIIVILATVAFSFIIILRSYCYSPFYDSDNPLAMNTGRVVIYTFLYCCLISLSTNKLIISTDAGSKQITFFITAVFFYFVKNPPTSSPIISRTTFVCGSCLLWTTGVIWLMLLSEQVLGSSSGSIWYYWGYSIPIVLVLAFLKGECFNRGYEWKSLFFESKEYNLTNLFLQVNQLIKAVNHIKKSDLGTNSVQFRALWKLIFRHNQKCVLPQCPLNVISSLRVQRQDQLLQHKRLNRTIQKTLQYGVYRMSRQRDQSPNYIPLSLQIANFQLEVFHLRTKGLQLFNKQLNRSQGEDQWGIYYLKKRIEGFEGSGEANSGQREQAIAEFKHEIEVSVSMLAEFWYFLADPKCNLKKLYDLANILFPLKRGVDEAWRTVKHLRNVECYHLYAKYLIKMFNDKEKGLKVLEEARRLQAQAHQRQQIVAGSDIASEQHGVIFLQFDGKNSGIMYQVNTACQRIFGFNKGELQGRKVNDIMPRLFATYHDRILEHYQQTNRPKMMNKERSVWGRAKNGYLFPFLIIIKPVRNYFSQTSQVYASVKRDLWMKERAFFFTDSDFNFTDISASMLPMFPELAGKIHLKKKTHLSQILPDYEQILPRLLQNEEAHEIMITRTINVSPTQAFSESVPFSIQAQEVSTAVAGMIGYYFKCYRGSGSSNPDPNVSSQNMSSMPGAQELGKQFKFMGSLNMKDEKTRMVFQGGVVKDSYLMKSQVLSRISNSLQKQKQQLKQQTVSRMNTNYVGEIKTKRLQGTFIRQIHQLTEESQNNGMAGNNIHEEEQGSLTEAIKPVELNSILERDTTNKPIFILKTLAILMLGLSTLLSILQYISGYSFKSSLVTSLTTYSSLNSLQAQTMFVNNFANLVVLNETTPETMITLASEINLLDSLTPSIPLTINSQLVYSDTTSQTMLLGFAINKLISEADQLATGDKSYSTEFFVVYNSVNGIEVGCQDGLRLLWSAISTDYSQALTFLALCVALLAGILIVQNIILRKVLNKKADILNIFFQIPRYSCSSFQKECQRFILRLSSENEDEELQLQALQDEDDPGIKRHTTQKKRTIMGQQKTATSFVFVSLLMLSYFLIYSLVVQGIQLSENKATSFTFAAVSDAMKVEKELAKSISFMNTYMVAGTYPLAGQKNSMGAITQQYNLIMELLNNVTTNFFYLGDILDQQYSQQFNSIMYANLCTNGSSCNYDNGEDKGLNVILYNYYNYIIQKYLVISSASSYNLSVLYSQSVQSQEQVYRVLMKTYWRQLEKIMIGGVQRYLQQHDPMFFGVMVTLCVINCTLILWGWMSFYSELQKKIMATEYILTFIPIDEINRNLKIVRYIKDKILKIR